MDIKNILILSMVKGVGPAFLKKNYYRLIHEISCEQIVNEHKPEELDNIEKYAKVADGVISDCKANEISMVSIFDADYPKQLLEISDPPSILFMRGNRSLINNTIAIIGTRNSTALGNNIAERLGAFFSKYFSICNGLVEGIDEHSIYQNGVVLSNVVGVVSGGLCYDETCSTHHKKIINDVLKAGGLVVSEYFPYQKEDKFSGSKASRIQAGLSLGLILVQSKLDGGSKYTINTFSRLPRVLGVIHYPSSKEYESDFFEANRTIVNDGMSGVAKIVGSKTKNNISLSSIVPISRKEDYEIFKSEILSQKQKQVSIF